MPFYVYELYDLRAGWILYVGQTTCGLGTRFSNHRGNPNELLKLWADEAGWDTIGVRLYKTCATRGEMCRVEKERIIEIEPPFNKHFQPGARDSRKSAGSTGRSGGV